MSLEYEITTDGTTVWVNSSDGAIARFGKNGIDIHCSLGEMVEFGTQCLQCTHQPTTVDDWRAFQDGMLKHHGISVSDGFMPKRFKKEANGS